MQRYLREIRPTLALAVPITIAQMSQMLMGITDSVMIGHTGAVPLAAAAFGVSVFNLFFVVGIGLMVPVAVLSSRARGAGRPADCGEYLRHGIALALAFGAAEALLIGVVSLRLDWFGQPPEVVAIVRPFVLLIGSSIISSLVYMTLRQFAESLGLPWIPTAVMTCGVAFNALLDWIFIFGHAGMPPMGLTGAGIATFCARLLSVLAIFLWLRKCPSVRDAWPRRWLAPLSNARLREMLRLGLPSAGSLLFESGAFVGSALMMGWIGAVALAAHQIAISCASMTFMFALGLAIAASMRISKALGAREHDRLRPISLTALGMGAAIACLFIGMYLSAGHTVASWFIHDRTVTALATRLLIVAAIFQLFDGSQVIFGLSLRGLGDVKVPALITFLAYWVVALPLGYFAGVRGRLGAVGVWEALALGLAFAAVSLGTRFFARTRTLAQGAAIGAEVSGAGSAEGIGAG